MTFDRRNPGPDMTEVTPRKSYYRHSMCSGICWSDLNIVLEACAIVILAFRSAGASDGADRHYSAYVIMHIEMLAKKTRDEVRCHPISTTTFPPGRVCGESRKPPRAKLR